jgi:hypothetical protein
MAIEIGNTRCPAVADAATARPAPTRSRRDDAKGSTRRSAARASSGACPELAGLHRPPDEQALPPWGAGGPRSGRAPHTRGRLAARERRRVRVEGTRRIAEQAAGEQDPARGDRVLVAKPPGQLRELRLATARGRATKGRRRRKPSRIQRAKGPLHLAPQGIPRRTRRELLRTPAHELGSVPAARGVHDQRIRCAANIGKLVPLLDDAHRPGD